VKRFGGWPNPAEAAAAGQPERALQASARLWTRRRAAAAQPHAPQPSVEAPPGRAPRRLARGGATLEGHLARAPTLPLPAGTRSSRPSACRPPRCPGVVSDAMDPSPPADGAQCRWGRPARFRKRHRDWQRTHERVLLGPRVKSPGDRRIGLCSSTATQRQESAAVGDGESGTPAGPAGKALIRAQLQGIRDSPRPHGRRPAWMRRRRSGPRRWGGPGADGGGGQLLFRPGPRGSPRPRFRAGRRGDPAGAVPSRLREREGAVGTVTQPPTARFPPHSAPLPRRLGGGGPRSRPRDLGGAGHRRDPQAGEQPAAGVAVDPGCASDV